MPHGYNGKILRVDLTNGSINVDEPETIVYRRYLGGSAFSLYHLLRELKKGVDPLSPDNVLIFACSVITGTRIAGASRFTIAAKSPLTNAYGESEAGGWWGPELKMAGFDAIIIKGRAPKPVYLWIHDGEAELRDASHLRGKITGEVEEIIRQELGDKRIRIAQTGPGGEKMVRFACVVNELHHVNGRTGMGAVMGSKNLRAVAVRGTGELSIADPDGVKAVQQWLRENYNHQPGDLHDLGTARLVRILNKDGILPTLNFRTGVFEKADDISGERMKETILKRRGTCFACPVACKRVVQTSGKYEVDPKYGGPEYETIAALGSCCGVGDLEAIAAANQICGQYCIDTISTGECIAFAMECFENGIIDKDDTDGIELRFGNAEAMVKMAEKIAKREGFGDLLAEGVMRAARKIGKGAEKFAMHVKGQELPMHEPRGKCGLTLSYATSPTGADHVEAPHDVLFTNLDVEDTNPASILGILEPVDLLDMGPRKAALFYHAQLIWSLYNSLGMCNFAAIPLGPLPLEKIVQLVRAVTGWNTSLFELMKVSERSSAMARAFNYREGLTKKDDTLPERLFQPLESGPLKGKRIEKEKWDEFLRTYYETMGWNPETGFPTKGKLAQLDLLWLEEVM